jgi:hypothetical protein
MKAPIDELPDDADAEAIRRVVRDGADLSRPMAIDFAVAFAARDSGERFQTALAGTGFRVSLEQDASGSTWTCYCTKTMLLTYRDVVRVQEELEELAAPLGGHADGWGTYGNT